MRSLTPCHAAGPSSTVGARLPHGDRRQLPETHNASERIYFVYQQSFLKAEWQLSSLLAMLPSTWHYRLHFDVIFDMNLELHDPKVWVLWQCIDGLREVGKPWTLWRLLLEALQTGELKSRSQHQGVVQLEERRWREVTMLMLMFHQSAIILSNFNNLRRHLPHDHHDAPGN